MTKAFISLLAAIFVLGACAKPGKKTAIGTGAGAAAGAIAGAVIGHQSGNKEKGAMIGGAAGAVLGGTIGNRLDRQAAELKKIAETRRTENGIVTTLKNSLLFDTASPELRSTAADDLDQISSILSKYPENRITVIGHADSRGSDAFNQTLSEKRAEAVKNKLVAGGVPAEAISALGKGEQSPVASNETEDGRAKNRRVELNITADESKLK